MHIHAGMVIRHVLKKYAVLMFVYGMLVCSSGCAIHYFDPETGTEHLWGFGHMQMKVSPPNEGVQAVVTGVETLGLAIGDTPWEGYVSLGYHRLERLQIIEESTAIRLEWSSWPNKDFTRVKVGTEFPYGKEDTDQTTVNDKMEGIK